MPPAPAIVKPEYADRADLVMAGIAILIKIKNLAVMGGGMCPRRPPGAGQTTQTCRLAAGLAAWQGWQRQCRQWAQRRAGFGSCRRGQHHYCVPPDNGRDNGRGHDSHVTMTASHNVECRMVDTSPHVPRPCNFYRVKSDTCLRWYICVSFIPQSIS